MFTGLVEEVGEVLGLTDTRIEIGATTVLEDAELGASIAVNGCCLTVVAFEEGRWSADVTAETFSRTNLGALSPGDPVNLERPMAAAARFGGHIVQGHVDCVGTIASPGADLRVSIPRRVSRYVVEKGSVAVNGVSLTVVDAVDDEFSVAVVPHTMAVTNLGSLSLGDVVNVEVDVIAKYVGSMLSAYSGSASINSAPAVRGDGDGAVATAQDML